MIGKILGAVAALALLAVAGLWLAARQVGPPGNLGPVQGRLAPCPASPNCVGSQAARGEQRVAPLEYRGDPEQAQEQLAGLLRSQPGQTIKAQRPGYIWAVCTSPWFGFRDDLEFLFSRQGKVIDVRSASRLGYSDLGANRRRVEDLRARWQKAAP